MSRVEGINIPILSTVKPFPLKSEDQVASWGLSKSGYCAALAGLGFIGAAVLTIATRWGIGLYADSIVYIGVARNILDGKGVIFFNDVGEITPVTQYPPFYSVTIALAGLVGLDPLEGARWISILFYVGNALLLAYIAYSSIVLRCRAARVLSGIECFSDGLYSFPGAVRAHVHFSRSPGVFFPSGLSA